MDPLEWFFWICVGIVAYTYIFYPIVLVILNALVRGAGGSAAHSATAKSVSVLLPVYNEEQNLPRRLDELKRMLPETGGEIIVISDASTDRSADIAREAGVRVIEMPTKSGKAAALNAAAALAQHEFLVFADARQRWADDAMARLIENFADPTIGAVSGDLMLESAPGVLAGVGLYWRFEKWLRKQESRLGSQVGVTGAISAVRRNLFVSIPPGTLLDDVYWPMHVVLQGHRVIHDERAKAYDRLPDKPKDEFRRKVRTLAGNFQLLTLLPVSALLPWSNRVWWQWISHKLMRLIVPWALLGMFVSSFLLREDIYTIFFWVQTAVYGIALLGVIPALGRTLRLLGAAGSFLVLNAAAWVAFWVWITGRAGTSWHKVQYQETVHEA
ncbi:MAG TPA: glycosyltransferase [Gemmataceae bacterium]|nr:glycosyltransferase [Gemmataceae bacterium]